MKRSLRLRWELATEFWLFSWDPTKRGKWFGANYCLTLISLREFWRDLTHTRGQHRHFRVLLPKQVRGRDWACVYREVTGGSKSLTRAERSQP